MEQKKVRNNLVPYWTYTATKYKHGFSNSSSCNKPRYGQPKSPYEVLTCRDCVLELYNTPYDNLTLWVCGELELGCSNAGYPK